MLRDFYLFEISICAIATISTQSSVPYCQTFRLDQTFRNALSIVLEKLHLDRFKLAT